MKKFLLSISLLVFATVIFAQQANVKHFQKNRKNDIKKVYSTISTTPNIIPSVSSAAPPIYSDDFSDPANWIIDHDPLSCDLDWQIGINSCTGYYPLVDIESTTASNGWAMIDSDSYGGATGGTEMEDCWLTMANPVDLNGYPHVNVEFETYYKSYDNEKAYIVVGIGDGSGNVVWPDLEASTVISGMTNVFEAFPGYGVQDETGNPEVIAVNISSALVGLTPTQLADIYIRFNWTGTWGYAWFVDDFVIAETPDNLVVCYEESFGGWWIDYQTVGGYGQDYTLYPISQATAQPYNFEAALRNAGIASQIATMHVNVTGAGSFSTASNPSLLLAAGESDTVAGIDKFTPTATGLYNVEMWAEVDSAGLGNVITYSDTATKETRVTDYIYGKDGDEVTGYRQLNYVAPIPGGYEIGASYEIYADATLYSIDAHISGWSIPGAEVYAALYAHIPFTDPVSVNLLALSDNYVITPSDTGAWVNIPFVTPQLLTSAAKTYIITIGSNLHPTDSVGLNVCHQSDYYSVDYAFDKDDINANNSPTWFQGYSWTPMLRMNFNPATFSAISDVKQTIFNVYPNPTNGVFSIELDKTEKYDVTVYNVLGQIVFSTVTNTMITTIDLSSFDKGIYTVELNDETGIYTQQVIIK